MRAHVGLHILRALTNTPEEVNMVEPVSLFTYVVYMGTNLRRLAPTFLAASVDDPVGLNAL
jgi:hypothetical protein